MKKVLLMILVLMSVFGFTGCTKEEKKIEIGQQVVNATLNEQNDIVINEDDITSNATFLSYEVDGITIGFIVVRGTDNKVRIAFNTCQSCTPSPNAYFIQKKDYFECQNCGNRFHIDKIGIEKGGCNPAPVEKMTQEDGIIVISSDYAKTYKDNFENWNGPKAEQNM